MPTEDILDHLMNYISANRDDVMDAVPEFDTDRFTLDEPTIDTLRIVLLGGLIALKNEAMKRCDVSLLATALDLTHTTTNQKD